MKILGSALLITGTAIGAGMLGIPMATAQLGFWGSISLLVVVWALSYFAALLMLEVTLNAPGDKLHLNSMAKATLGKFGQIAAWICVLGLLYSLTVAYVDGASSILHTATGLPQWMLATGFTVILGTFVIISHRAADLLNRSFFSVKTLCLIVVLAFSLPFVDGNLLQSAPVSNVLFLTAAPVIFVSFGFHHIIPSLTQYNEGNVPVLKRIILIGSLLPLIVYIFWQIISLGLLPADTLSEDVGEYLVGLSSALNRPWLGVVINGFANLALITSFLGVTLGLFDFLCDAFKVDTARFSHRLGIGLITYLMPLYCAIFIPAGFIQLLAYGGVFFAAMAYVLPGLMAIALRRRGLAHTYQAPGSWLTPVLLIIAGVVVIGVIIV